MVYHPSWGYFAKEYGLTQIPVEIEGKRPKPAQLQRLIETARRYGDIAPNGTLLDGYIERVFYDVRDSEVQVLAIVSKADASEWLGQFGE